MCVGSRPNGPESELVVIQCLDTRLSADQSILLGLSLVSDDPSLFTIQQIDMSRVD